MRGKTAHAAERRVHPTEAAGTSATGINTQELNSNICIREKLIPFDDDSGV